MVMAHLVLIRGPAGSGKSTLSDKVGKRIKGNVVVLHKDLFHFQIPQRGKVPVREILSLISEFLLSRNFSVVLDGLFGGATARKSILELKRIARRANAKFTLVFLDTNKDVCLERNRKRKKAIPVKDVHKWYDYIYKTKAEKGIVINNNHLSEREALRKIMREMER